MSIPQWVRRAWCVHCVGKCLDIVSVGLHLPRLLGEVNMEAFFYMGPRKQSYIFHGGSLILWLIPDVLVVFFAAGVVAENGSF